MDDFMKERYRDWHGKTNLLNISYFLLTKVFCTLSQHFNSFQYCEFQLSKVESQNLIPQTPLHLGYAGPWSRFHQSDAQMNYVDTEWRNMYQPYSKSHFLTQSSKFDWYNPTNKSMSGISRIQVIKYNLSYEFIFSF